MATEILTRLTSDLSGEEASITIEFSIGNAHFAFDATEKEADEFHQALTKYTTVARRVGGKASKGGRGRSSNTQGYDAKEVRNWAAEAGIQIGDRGRIPTEVLEKYFSANK